MDIQKDYFCLEQNNRVMCKNQDVDFDLQETLPAYLDDIYRVVKCSAQSCVTSADINFNEVKVFGRVNVRLTYYNEDSGLCYADFEEEFNRSVTVENLSDNAFVCADICDKYVSFRVINQRRIDIHLSSVLHIDVYDKTKYPCLCSADGAKLKTEKIKAADIIGFDISKAEFDEEFNIPSDSPPIKRIISYSAFSNVAEVKVIKDKALIKGVVNLFVLYTADTKDEELLRSEYSFNVSKIVQIAGIGEDDIIISNSRVENVFLKSKNSSGDKLNSINAYGEVVFNSVIIRESEKEAVTDAYILNRNSDSDYISADMLTDGKRISETKQVTLQYTIPSDVTSVEELSFEIVSTSYKDGKITVGTRINAVVKNSDAALQSVSLQADTQIETENYDGAIISLGILSYDYSLGDEKITLRASLVLDAYLYNETSVRLISDITPDDAIDPPSLTVYFGRENEGIWDIAKSFSSDEELIKKENGLTGDTLDSNRVLIIPKA